MEISNKMHLANQIRWNAAARRWGENADSRGIWNACHEDPSMVFNSAVLKNFKDIKGKEVCVLGSGDNQAVFALAGMGAKVTSVDISIKQLSIAKKRAKSLGLAITFIESDVVNLEKIQDAKYDMTYTGGHVAVWVSDLAKYYKEAVRILKSGGIFMVDEYHPFRRIWKESKTNLVIEHNYFHRGPYKYQLNDNVLYATKGNLDSFEFHWTVSDIVNAMISAGTIITKVEEYGLEYEGWESIPSEGLPLNLFVVGIKK